MGSVQSHAEMQAASAVSANVDAHLAAEAVVESVGPALDSPDVAFVFAGGAHGKELGVIGEVVRRGLRPGLLVGVSAEGVLADGEEVENAPAVSLFAADLPGATLAPFRYRDLPSGEPNSETVGRAVARDLKIGTKSAAVLLLADPFSVPANRAISLIESATEHVLPDHRRVPVIGGMASGGKAPGDHLLLLDDHMDSAGAVGVSISGNVRVDTLVSQGCRPIGRPMVITECHRNIVKKLGGKPALGALQELVDELDPEDRQLLQKGLFVGVVIDEYKERFGRGDFLVRSVLGVDQNSGSLAFGDIMRTGQTVQFHARDAETASEDLHLLLDAERVGERAAGALVFTCNGRGHKLFGEPHHDARAISGALGRESGPCPTAGFFAAGEIGPIGDRSFVHGHTAVAAIFRPR